MTEDKSTIKKTTLTLSDKRDLMWNFTEPGDPYDIRKSMIAKLPGEKKFMGPHLELICLLQAAEIQRLCQYLEQFKMRFRQNQRVELDRHSYQVQIKELTQKLSEEHISRVQIQKLREFIRRQSIELQELQRAKHNAELSKNYEQSLRQIAELKQLNTKLNLELRTYQSKMDSYQQQRLQDLDALKQQLDKKNMLQLQQEQRYKQNSARWEIERRRFEQEIQSFAQVSKNLKELDTDRQNLKKENERLILQSSKTQQLGHTIKQYENRFQMLADQIQRLNNVLRQKSRELTEQYARSRQLSEVNQRLEEELSQRDSKINQLTQANSKLMKEYRETLVSLSNLEQTKSLTQSYEASLQKFSIEVDRLNNVLRKKLNELQQARRKNNGYEIKLKTLQSIEKQLNDYKIKYSQVNKKISNYQKELAQTIQENERLNYSIKKLIGELNTYQIKFKNYQKEIQNLQQTVNILSSQIQHQRQGKQKLANQLSQISHQNQTLKYTISKYQDSRKVYDTKIGQYVSQIKKLKIDLEHREGQVQLIKNSKSQTQLKIRQVQSINQNDQMYIEELLSQNKKLYEENQKLKNIIDANKAQALQNLKRPPKAPASKEKSEVYGSQGMSGSLQIAGEGGIYGSPREFQTGTQGGGQNIPNTANIDYNQLITRQYQEISRLSNILAQKDQEIGKLHQAYQELKLSASSFRRGPDETQPGRSSPSSILPYQTPLQSGQKPQFSTVGPNQLQELQRQNYEQDLQISRLKEDLQNLQLNLINKQQTMRYYINDNERFYIQNGQLKNNIHERDLRIERLQNEIDKIQGIVNQKSFRTVDNQDIEDSHVRTAIQYEVLKEKYGILSDQNQANIERIHNQQDQIIKLQYRLTHNERNTIQEQNVQIFSQIPYPKTNQDKEKEIEKLKIEINYWQEKCSKLTKELNQQRGKKIYKQQNVPYIIYPKQMNTVLPSQQSNPPASLFSNEQYNNILLKYNKLSLDVANLTNHTKRLQQQNTSSNQIIRQLKQQNIQLQARRQNIQPQSNQIRKKNQQITEYYNKILIFSSQIQRLNDILLAEQKNKKQKQILINDYRQKIDNYQLKLRDINIQLQTLKTKDTKYLYNDEKNRLLEDVKVLAQKNTRYQQQIRDLQNREVKLRLEYEQQKRTSDNKVELLQKEILRLNSALEVKLQEKRAVEQINRNLQNRLRNITNQADQQKISKKYQAKIALLSQQIQRLNSALKLKIQNNTIIEQEYHRYQTDTFNRINDQARELRQYQQENLSLKSQISNLKSQDGIKSLQVQSLNEYQAKILQVSNEMQRLNRILYLNKQTIQELSQKQAKYRSQIQRLNNSLRLKVEQSFMFQDREKSWSNQRQGLIMNVNDRQREYQILLGQYKAADQQNYVSKQHLAQYQKRIKELYQEFQRLQKIITTFKENQDKNKIYINEVVEKNRFLGAEIRNLNSLNEDQKKELSDLRLVLVDDGYLQRRIEEHLALFVVLFAEIESLRATVSYLEYQIKESRKQNVEARLV